MANQQEGVCIHTVWKSYVVHVTHHCWSWVMRKKKRMTKSGTPSPVARVLGDRLFRQRVKPSKKIYNRKKTKDHQHGDGPFWKSKIVDFPYIHKAVGPTYHRWLSLCRREGIPHNERVVGQPSRQNIATPQGASKPPRLLVLFHSSLYSLFVCTISPTRSSLQARWPYYFDVFGFNRARTIRIDNVLISSSLNL